MDLSAAYQEVKTLPDDALARELQSPSGMLPGYLVMAEMEDRKAIRSSGGGAQAPKTSMKDELLSGFNPAPPVYANGGLVGSVNPFYAMVLGMRNPQMRAVDMTNQMKEQNGGYMPTNPLAQPGVPQAPPDISQMMPTPSGALQEPERYGGLGSLMR